METWRGVPILYSLGNFVACEVPYTSGDRVTWNRTERTGCILKADLSRGGVGPVSLLPTYDDGVRVGLDETGFGRERLGRATRALARGVTLGRYRREYFWTKTVVPLLAHLRWSSLKRLRPRKVLEFLTGAARAARAE
jgi:poly-gamma-glutamate synthesis protein (capsule biosynthesis protein)